MSTTQLQRVMTRMLFDPALARAVYDDPAGALRGVDITEEERALLTRPDPRRWRADAERPHRALEGLLAHLPVTLALRATLGGEPAPLLEFFGSEAFHEAIMSRALLSGAFAGWLTTLSPLRESAWGAPLAALEVACAELRAAPLGAAARAPSSPRGVSPLTPTRLSPRARLLWLPEGCVERLEVARAALAPLAPLAALSPLPLAAEERAALCAPREALAGVGREGVLLERAGALGEVATVGVSALPPALAALLARAAEGGALGELLALVEGAGVSPEDAREVVAGLFEDGLITLASAP